MNREKTWGGDGVTVYADLIFVANFFGDFLCLWLCSALYRRIPVWRRIVAAALGGLYGAVAAISGLEFLSSLWAKVIFAIPIGAVAYMPAPPKEIVRSVAAFCISSFFLSGAVELVGVSGGAVRTMLAVFGSACIIICFISLMKSRIYARYMSCELSFDGRKVRYTGFYDSGNRLISGKDGERVIIADERLLKKLFPSPPAPERVIDIPFVSCASGMMKGIKLDYAKIDGRIYDDVVLAISETRLADGLILHSTMV